MGRMPRIQVENAVYYILSGGDNNEPIFIAPEDSTAYIDLLGQYKTEHPFKLFAYCLIPSAISLLLEPSPDTAISEMMHNLNSKYTRYFNHKYNKTGHLFQERYRMVLIEKESKLLEMATYVNLRPKLHTPPFDIKTYAYSSYLAYIKEGGVTGGPNIKEDVKEVLSYLKGRTYPEIAAHTELPKLSGIDKELANKQIIGSELFVKEVRSKMSLLRAPKDQKVESNAASQIIKEPYLPKPVLEPKPGPEQSSKTTTETLIPPQPKPQQAQPVKPPTQHLPQQQPKQEEPIKHEPTLQPPRPQQPPPQPKPQQAQPVKPMPQPIPQPPRPQQPPPQPPKPQPAHEITLELETEPVPPPQPKHKDQEPPRHAPAPLPQPKHKYEQPSKHAPQPMPHDKHKHEEHLKHAPEPARQAKQKNEELSKFISAHMAYLRSNPGRNLIIISILVVAIIASVFLSEYLQMKYYLNKEYVRKETELKVKVEKEKNNLYRALTKKFKAKMAAYENSVQREELEKNSYKAMAEWATRLANERDAVQAAAARVQQDRKKLEAEVAAFKRSIPEQQQ